MGRIIKADAADRAALAPLQTDAAKAAAEVVIAANRAVARLAEDAEEHVIELALRMAEKIVASEIEADPTRLDSIYRRALAAANDMERGTLVVHPADRAAFAVDALATDNGLVVREDSDVRRGGCRIVSGGQTVDATIQTALDCFERAMKGTLHEPA